MRKIIFFVLLICGTNSVLFAQKKSTASAAAPTNFDLKWDKMEYEFGEIPQGTPATAKFKLTNTTKQVLLLKNVKGGCGCTTTDYDKTPIKPGKSTIVNAIYDAAAEGSFSKSVKVTTNLSDDFIMLIIKGKVTPKAKK